MANKIYTHLGNGHYIGSAVIVVAASLEEAEALIRFQLDSIGLSEEGIDIVSAVTIKANSVIYVNSGDY